MICLLKQKNPICNHRTLGRAGSNIVFYIINKETFCSFLSRPRDCKSLLWFADVCYVCKLVGRARLYPSCYSTSDRAALRVKDKASLSVITPRDFRFFFIRVLLNYSSSPPSLLNPVLPTEEVLDSGQRRSGECSGRLYTIPGIYAQRKH